MQICTFCYRKIVSHIGLRDTEKVTIISDEILFLINNIY